MMTDEINGALCQRLVVLKKEFYSIGWGDLVAGLSYLVAVLLNESLARSLTNNTWKSKCWKNTETPLMCISKK